MKKNYSYLFTLLIAGTLVIFGPGCNEETSPHNLPSSSSQSEAEFSFLKVVDELCRGASRCDSKLDQNSCIEAVKREPGRKLWDNFGLQKSENQFSYHDLINAIEQGKVKFHPDVVEDCMHESIELCDQGERFDIGNYDNLENLIIPDGACSRLLE